MGKNIWYGFSIGIVVGAGSDHQGAGGGAKSGNDDSDSDNGYQGLFSLFGHETWLYIGGVMGFGDAAGVYLTTGPMIGKDPDWAIGGGIHLAKAIGLGVVIPIRQAMETYKRNEDKIPAIIDSIHKYASQAHDYINYVLGHTHVIAAHLPNITSGLEEVIKRI